MATIMGRDGLWGRLQICEGFMRPSALLSFDAPVDAVAMGLTLPECREPSLHWHHKPRHSMREPGHHWFSICDVLEWAASGTDARWQLEPRLSSFVRMGAPVRVRIRGAVYSIVWFS